MSVKVFAVWDTKGMMYGQPFCFPSIGAALRDFGDAVANPKTSIAAHPSDYILFQIGDYDECTGVLNSLMPPLRLGIGSDFVPVAKAVDPVRVALENPLATVSEVNGAVPA